MTCLMMASAALLAGEVIQQLSAACLCFCCLQRVGVGCNALKQHMHPLRNAGLG